MSLPEGFVLDEQPPEGFVIDQPGDDRLSGIPEIAETGFGGLGLPAEAAKLAPALLTTTNPDEFAQIITSNFPEIGAVQPGPGQAEKHARL